MATAAEQQVEQEQAIAAFSAGFTIRSAFEHVDDMLKDLR